MKQNNANYPQIRLFDVRTDFKENRSRIVKENGRSVHQGTAPDFSALAYFFAREIFNRTKVPRGTNHNTVGGSCCQA